MKYSKLGRKGERNSKTSLQKKKNSKTLRDVDIASIQTKTNKTLSQVGKTRTQVLYISIVEEILGIAKEVFCKEEGNARNINL